MEKEKYMDLCSEKMFKLAELLETGKPLKVGIYTSKTEYWVNLYEQEKIKAELKVLLIQWLFKDLYQEDEKGIETLGDAMALVNTILFLIHFFKSEVSEAEKRIENEKKKELN